jgi:hypothetical protein
MASFFLDYTRLALIGGYAGSDFLEGLMKIILKNKFSNLVNKEKPKSKFGELLKK